MKLQLRPRSRRITLAVYAIARATFGVRAEARVGPTAARLWPIVRKLRKRGIHEHFPSRFVETGRWNVRRFGNRGAVVRGIGGRKSQESAGAGAAKRVRIGLQLYSVREQCAKDLPGVLAAVAKIGFEGVEFAGYHGRTAQELRTMLDANGLKCCGTHTGWNTLQGDELKKTVEFNKILGNPYLICPGLPHDQVKSVEAIKTTAKFFTDLAQKVKSDGLRAGYHAHGGDFQKFDGVTVWDLLFSNAGPDVCMQLDIGNCLGGGGDPYAILRKFPCRSATIHIKEFGGEPGAPIGEGKVKWNEIFEPVKPRATPSGTSSSTKAIRRLPWKA